MLVGRCSFNRIAHAHAVEPKPVHLAPAGRRIGHRHALKIRLSQLWLALRVGLWISVLPLVLRTTSLRHVLQVLTPPRARPGPRTCSRWIKPYGPSSGSAACGCSAAAVSTFVSAPSARPLLRAGAGPSGDDSLRGDQGRLGAGGPQLGDAPQAPIADDLRSAGFKTIYRYPPAACPRD